MIVNDRMHWFLSIRQLLWNLFCAGRGDPGSGHPRLAAFVEAEVSLFKLIVGDGVKQDEVSASLRYDDEISVRVEGPTPDVWEPEILTPEHLLRLTYDQTFAHEHHRAGSAQYVQLKAEMVGADGGTETRNILIQSDYVDFHLGEAGEVRPARPAALATPPPPARPGGRWGELGARRAT
jgi:hypothetical protein